MDVLLSYINTQLFIFALKLVRYQSNRTITASFPYNNYIIACDGGWIASPNSVKQIAGVGSWSTITYGYGKYIIGGGNGYISTSGNGINWTAPKQVGNKVWRDIIYANGKFVIVEVVIKPLMPSTARKFPLP